MKRLSGWDAFLLYTETPNVHMHTLKIAIIDVSAVGERKFGIDEFRAVLADRLYKLDPFRYQLVDIPLKFHHPMWREHCDVDLDYHIRPWQLPAPGTNPDFRNIDELTGRALLMHLSLAYRVCSQPEGATYYLDEAALRAQRSDVFDTNEDAAPALAQVGSPGQIWAWFRFSTEAEGSGVLRPADVAAAPDAAGAGAAGAGAGFFTTLRGVELDRPVPQTGHAPRPCRACTSLAPSTSPTSSSARSTPR